MKYAPVLRVLLVACINVIVLLFIQPALSQVTAVSVIPGYICMEQDKADDRSPTLDNFPPVYKSSRPDAPQFGVAAGIILATNPPRVENGRRQILRIDGSTAWVDVGFLRPWVGRTPEKRCTPVILSNGRRGEDIR